MTRRVEERGFYKLIDEVIVKIDTSAINVVHIYTKSGKVVSIDAEDSHCGIPVISADRYWGVKND